MSTKRNSGSKPSKGPGHQGSVQRARQMLAAGERPKVLTPVQNEPEVSSKASHMTQWPLPDNSTLPGNFLDPQASLIPRGPPPPRPPRPDMPSPSIYSERSAPGVAPSPLHVKQAYPSFSQPLPQRSAHISTKETSSPANRTSAANLAPRIAVTNEDSSRRSAISDTSSLPTIPDFPLPSTNKPMPINHRKSASLAPPPQPLSNAVRHAFSRRSSVSPIPEELSDEPSNLEGSYASSKAVPSWGSVPRDSGVLGAYLDDESDDDEESRKSTEENGEGLVRHASVGKRGKPSLRVIQKPNSSSPAPPDNGPLTTSHAGKAGSSLPGTTTGQNGGLKVSSPKDSVSSISDRSYEFDLEKGAFMLDIGQPHPTPQQAQRNGTGNLGIGAGGLPGPTPTMSVRRPGARRPPRLDMNAVRDAETRGSLTSLSDLIKRATRLATNLDHGRTASRNDVLNGNGDSRAPPWGWRKSGSLNGALESFPPPPRPEDRHSSWPAFFRRSTFHNIDAQGAHSDHDQEKRSNRPRRCCGMPLWLFITICVLILLAITVAVLLPVFLIVVPRENPGLSSCERSNPCKNGGVSVSSGPICSCVCTNGYTGSQCTIAGDGSCTTSDIGEGSTSKSATMGSDLPQLLEDSQKTFSISLDPVTIMALFSQNDVSCTTQNELVSFKDVASNKNNSSNTRRSAFTEQAEDLLSDTEPSSTSASPLNQYRKTLAARASVATMNGIIFDNSSPSSEDSSTGTQNTASAAEETTPPESTSTSTPTTTASSSSATATSTSKSTSVPQKAVDFSRTAVLYILEMTGTFDAAMESEENIQSYLKDKYPTSGAGNYTVNLPKSGVKGNFALDFDKYSITMSNGTSVGGS